MEALISIFQSVIRAGTPLLLGTIGQIYIEKSGVMNLGTEGMMIVGAATAFMAAMMTGNPWLGLAAAMASGICIGLVYGAIVVSLKGNQTISGLAVAMFGLGMSSLIGRGFVGMSAPHIGIAEVPLLSSIPVIGPLFFKHDPLVYVSIILAILTWFVLYKTLFGLRIRAVGDSPETADSMGVDVYRTRYISLAIGGALIGLSGGYLSLIYVPAWIEGMTAGRGWIVIALAVFSMWDPARALVGAYIFGGVEVLQYNLQAYGVSPALLAMTPYLTTIAVLAVSSREPVRRRLGVPRSLGKPFYRER